jgi:all-trans-8'-apo-beta-carotenal 15,15'-oxygenase
LVGGRGVVSGDSLIAGFIGYDAPDHFLGPHAVPRNIMRGRDGTAIQPGSFHGWWEPA